MWVNGASTSLIRTLVHESMHNAGANHAGTIDAITVSGVGDGHHDGRVKGCHCSQLHATGPLPASSLLDLASFLMSRLQGAFLEYYDIEDYMSTGESA